ncbi:MerR family transcriptional regulator [Salicibibacter cibarius]|uniref:MerR family transcriptional regulator n=1 Tax=Salicibibacter cibarius TaxID=2743000 RepID=A0A7T6Z1M8_9BACI|nr:MerR family transcriptional regulator [Salicibibacter cibarius]QQK75325.1 MerR family transcriptional regulator [Salicibibacter cibarius]
MYTIGKLSKKTGVTIRTLDYYDEVGLLKPKSATEGGHRLYGDEEVMRLEHILALKYLGFSLEKIQAILHESARTWEEALSEQLLMVKDQKKRLDELEQSLTAVLYSIRIEDEVKWPLIFGAMQLFQQDPDKVTRVLDRYLNAEQKEKMLSVNHDEKKTKEWTALILEIRKHLHVSPESDVAQALADRWMEGVYNMFGDDEEFLGSAWDAISEESDDVMFYPMTKEVVTFITEAIRAKEMKENGDNEENSN